MIRVFNGDAYAFEESEYDWRKALHFFLDGHHNDYVLIYRDGRPIKALSYHDVCYNRDVPEKILYLDQDIFAEARKYFFVFRQQEERWKRGIPVIDLSVPNDGNQFTGGRCENVWEYFFEPLNEYSIDEVMQSRSVLVCDEKFNAFNPYMMEQYHDLNNMRAVCRKYLRLNQEMSAYVEQRRRQFLAGGGGGEY